MLSTETNRDILLTVLPNAGQTVGAVRASPLTRAERGRDNAHTARVTRTATPCPQEPYQEEGDGGCTPKVYVGNLHYDVVSEDLAKLFEQAGVVEFSEVSHLALHYLCMLMDM